MKRLALAFISACFFGILAPGCTKERCTDDENPMCENYDPCLKYKDLSAAFTIKEILAVDSKRKREVETDTCWAENIIKFSAVSKELDSVKWFIGDEILTDTVVYRTRFPDREHVTITMIAYYKSHAHCTNDLDGIDTVSKDLYAIRNAWDCPINGVYQGYNLGEEEDLFIIEVNDTTSQLNFPNPPVDITPFPRTGAIQGLPKGAPDMDFRTNTRLAFGGKHFFYSADAPEQRPVANKGSNFFMRSYGSLSGGRLRIEYTYDDNGLSNFLYGTNFAVPKDVSKVFIGSKLRFY